MISKLAQMTALARVMDRISSLRLVAMHLLLLAILAAPHAFATRTACEKALLAVQAVLGEGPKTELYDDEARHLSAPTIMVEAMSAGEHGGKRITLRRTGARWLSDYRSVQYDPQGDPRWFIEVMGTEAAEYFGFKILSDELVKVPDGDEFNGALKKINGQLKAMGKEPVELSFYVTSGNENTKVAEYVRAFGENGGIPLAAGGNHLVHDLSFHTGAIFFPGHLVRLAGYFARFLDGYFEFLTEKYAADPAKAAAVKHFAFLLRMNHTINIDTATGTVNAGIVASLRKPGSKESNELLFAPIALMSGQGNTARMYFAEKLAALSPSDIKYLHEYSGLITSGGVPQSARTNQALESLSIRELLDAMNTFAELKNVRGDAQFAEILVPPTESVMESLCRGIGLRRLVIRQAALALMGRT